jgi:hypothetical protein
MVAASAPGRARAARLQARRRRLRTPSSAAPRITYAPDSRPRDRLLTLLGELAIEPRELVADSGDRGWSGRFAAYSSARNRFIAAGREVRPSHNVVEMLAQVYEPVRAVLRTSPDFRLRTTRCCRWRRRFRGSTPPLPARCSTSWRRRSLGGPKPGSPCAISRGRAREWRQSNQRKRTKLMRSIGASASPSR